MYLKPCWRFFPCCCAELDDVVAGAILKAFKNIGSFQGTARWQKIFCLFSVGFFSSLRGYYRAGGCEIRCILSWDAVKDHKIQCYTKKCHLREPIMFHAFLLNYWSKKCSRFPTTCNWQVWMLWEKDKWEAMSLPCPPSYATVITLMTSWVAWSMGEPSRLGRGHGSIFQQCKIIIPTLNCGILLPLLQQYLRVPQLAAPSTLLHSVYPVLLHQPYELHHLFANVVQQMAPPAGLVWGVNCTELVSHNPSATPAFPSVVDTSSHAWPMEWLSSWTLSPGGWSWTFAWDCGLLRTLDSHIWQASQ